MAVIQLFLGNIRAICIGLDRWMLLLERQQYCFLDIKTIQVDGGLSAKIITMVTLIFGMKMLLLLARASR